MSFPASPYNGQQAVFNNINYIYSAATNAWTRVPTYIGTVNNGIYVTSATANTAPTIIDSIALAGNTGVRWTTTAIDNVSANVQMSTVDVLANVNTVNYTEYGVLSSNPAVTVAVFTSNVYLGNIVLWAQGVSASVTVTTRREILGANTTPGYINVGPAGPPGNVAAALSTYTGTVSAGNITTISGVFWANGNAYSSGSGISVTTSNTAPSSPTVGSQWYYPPTDTLFEYIYDGTNRVWVDVAGSSLSNVTANASIAGNLTISGNIIPGANVAYNIGTPTARFASLYLSGNTIDLGGAVIKSDAATGAIALIPTPSVANPNPVGIVVSPTGTLSTVSTTGGVVSANAIANSSNSAASTGSSITGNLAVSGNSTVAGNLTIAGSLSVSGNTTFINTIITNENLPGNLNLGIPLSFNAINANLQLGGTQNSYLQAAFQNQSSGSAATTDVVAFADTGTNSYNFTDFGITSSTYSQPGYGLTQANDGYLYVQGNSAGTSGNLVLSTYNPTDIIFSTGGGDYANEMARFSNSSAALIIKSTTTANTQANTGALQVWGGASITGNLNAGKVYSGGADVIGTALAFSIALG